MIILTKLDGSEFVLNCDLIEFIQANPDTTIRLIDDKIMIVKESLEEVVQKTIDYRRKIYIERMEKPIHIKQDNKENKKG